MSRPGWRFRHCSISEFPNFIQETPKVTVKNTPVGVYALQQQLIAAGYAPEAAAAIPQSDPDLLNMSDMDTAVIATLQRFRFDGTRDPDPERAKGRSLASPAARAYVDASNRQVLAAKRAREQGLR